MAKRPKIDPLWDAMLAVMGIAPDVNLTPSARQTYNAKHRELRATINPIPPNKVSDQELYELSLELPRRADYYRQKYPTWAFTIPAIVKHWATLTPKKTSKEVFQQFVNEWYFANQKVLSGLDPFEVQRLYLRINRDDVCKRWPEKSSIRGHIDELMAGTLQYCCDLSPQQIKPHVKAALDKLQAKEAE